MSHDLYFIPMLARALESSDARAALREAFERIRTVASEPRNAVGFFNFKRFMDEAAQVEASTDSEPAHSPGVRSLIVELATGTFDGKRSERRAAERLLQTSSCWQAEYEELRAASGRAEGLLEIVVLELQRGDDRLAQIELAPDKQPDAVSGIKPGAFSLWTWTGQLLWQAELAPEHVLWSAAYPGRSLDLAAETGESMTAPTMSDLLLGGELTLTVYPGLECGRIELTLRADGRR